jgi:hypothetical protein
MNLADVFPKIAEQANVEFDPTTLEIGQLICSLDVGNDKFYKVFGIGVDTVDIALPDMVMVTVKKSSLYDGVRALEIFIQ